MSSKRKNSFEERRLKKCQKCGEDILRSNFIKHTDTCSLNRNELSTSSDELEHMENNSEKVTQSLEDPEIFDANHLEINVHDSVRKHVRENITEEDLASFFDFNEIESESSSSDYESDEASNADLPTLHLSASESDSDESSSLSSSESVTGESDYMIERVIAWICKLLLL